MKTLAMCLGLVALAVAAARADIITLTDGTTLDGSIHKTDTGWVITDSTGKQTNVREDEVKAIALTPRVSTETSDARLESLRNSVEHSSDIPQIISRYKQFLSQYATGAAHDSAVKDLAAWQDRLDKGLVRYGSDWVTPAELAQRQHESAGVIAQAASLIQAGQMKDALTQLQPLLSADPHNPPALYLRGTIQYSQSTFPAARNDFEAILTTAPNHGPSLNNVAVIFFRQKQWGRSLNYFDQAMIAMPENQTILDNMVEVFDALPAEAKDTPIAKKTARLFAEQDPLLQQAMAANGLSRWGATWIDQKQIDGIHAAQSALDAKLADLDSQYRGAQQQIATIDQQINNNSVQMTQYMTSQSYIRDPYGNLVQTPYPSQYYALSAQNDQLNSQKQVLQGKLSSLQAQATTAKKQVPSPQFTGILRLYGTDGVTSLLGPPGAATQQAVDARAPAAATPTPFASTPQPSPVLPPVSPTGNVFPPVTPTR